MQASSEDLLSASTQNPEKGPRFYASGASATELMRLAKYGLDIAVLDAQVGAASALKLAYAGMTKGFTAIATAMLHAASREGLADALRAELARTQPQFLARLERSIPDMFPKAYRWVAEMEQIAEFIGDSREGAIIYDGFACLYEWIASELNQRRERQYRGARRVLQKEMTVGIWRSHRGQIREIRTSCN